MQSFAALENKAWGTQSITSSRSLHYTHSRNAHATLDEGHANNLETWKSNKSIDTLYIEISDTTPIGLGSG